MAAHPADFTPAQIQAHYPEEVAGGSTYYRSH
jgi:hypothetical protein